MCELIELIKDLVKIESTNPGLYEKEISYFVRNWFLTQGIETQTCKMGKDRENVMATLLGEDEEDFLIDINHMDVVIAGEGWESHPFIPVEKEDRLFGRGALDMKAGLAIGMITFRNIYHHYQRLAQKPLKSYRFIATVDEEGEAMGGVEALIKAGFIPKNSFVIDHEPTNEALATAHKGKIFFKLFHSDLTHLMENIAKIHQFIEGIEVVEGFGKPTVCFGTLGKADCEYFVSMDIRLTPALEISYMKDFMDSLCDRGGRVEVLLARPAIDYHKEKHPLMRLFQDRLEKEGQSSQEVLFTGYTDTAVIAQKVSGVKVVSFGPSGYGLHQPNEWVSISSVKKIASICQEVYFQWLKLPREKTFIYAISFYGKRAHGSTPWQGIDSIALMSGFLKELRAAFPQIAILECFGGDSINVMAESCHLRLAVDDGFKDLEEYILKYLEALREKHKGFSYVVQGECVIADTR